MMEEEEVVKVQADIVDVKYDLMSNSIFLKVSVEGKTRAHNISPESFIKFDCTPEQSRSIMMKYSESLKQRVLPLFIEMTREQLELDGDE